MIYNFIELENSQGIIPFSVKIIQIFFMELDLEHQHFTSRLFDVVLWFLEVYESFIMTNRIKSSNPLDLFD